MQKGPKKAAGGQTAKQICPQAEESEGVMLSWLDCHSPSGSMGRTAGESLNQSHPLEEFLVSQERSGLYSIPWCSVLGAGAARGEHGLCAKEGVDFRAQMDFRV